MDIFQVLFFTPLHAAPVVPEGGASERDVDHVAAAPHHNAQIAVAEDGAGLYPGEGEISFYDVIGHNLHFTHLRRF